MVGHQSDLPYFNLWKDAMYLGDFFLEDDAPQIGGHQMWERLCPACCPYITLQTAEHRRTPLYAQRHHIEPDAIIVAPLRTPMLAVAYITRHNAQAKQILLSVRHPVVSFVFLNLQKYQIFPTLAKVTTEKTPYIISLKHLSYQAFAIISHSAQSLELLPAANEQQEEQQGHDAEGEG